MKHAWIEHNQIRDIAPGNPAEFYHPDIAQHYDTEVPDDAENGDTFVDGVLTKRPVPEPVTAPEPVVVAPVPPKVGPIHFKMLFTPAERVKAKALRSTDYVIDDFWGLLDDPRTDTVDMSLESIQRAIEYTLGQVNAAGVEVDVEARKVEILTGVLK